MNARTGVRIANSNASAARITCADGNVAASFDNLTGRDLAFKTGKTGTHELNADGLAFTNICVEYGNGDNRMFVNNVETSQFKLTSGSTTGPQVVTLGEHGLVHVKKNMNLRLGDGDAEVNLGAVRVDRDQSLVTGAGDDDITVGATVTPPGLGIRVGGATLINTGKGDDLVRVAPENSVTFVQSLRIDLSDGNDEVELGPKTSLALPPKYTLTGGLGTNTMYFSKTLLLKQSSIFYFAVKTPV